MPSLWELLSGGAPSSQRVPIGRHNLPAFHGTHRPDFAVFQRSPADLGIHFGDAEQASHRAMQFGVESGGRVIPAWLSLHNPLRLPDVGDWYGSNVANALLHVPEFAEHKRYLKRLARGNFHKSAIALQQLLISKGYDGVVYRNAWEGDKPRDSYIVFDPRQVRMGPHYQPAQSNALHGLLS